MSSPRRPSGGRTPVLLAAAGAPWEAAALRSLAQGDVVVLKRCVDLPDLLASAATGEAAVAVVSGDLEGLDTDSMVRLLRHEVRCVAVGGDPDALGRLGVAAVLAPEELEGSGSLCEVVTAAATQDLVVDADRPEVDPELDPEPAQTRSGRVIAVHGPTGAPGRTTVAIGLAAEHAHRGHRCVLVDADPHGGAVAQHLGVLDEVSGLLASARLANAGGLDDEAFARCRRVVADRLEVVTGLPRPDRWVEARAGMLDVVLARASGVGDVLVDTGFSLEDPEQFGGELGRSLARNQLTLDAVSYADVVVAVGTAEPTGLARLARTLVELRDSVGTPLVVVVNRMRDSLGWSRRDIVGMIEGYVRPSAVHFLPEDRAATDRALVAGRSLVELGESPLRQGLSELLDAVLEPAQNPPISR